MRNKFYYFIIISILLLLLSPIINAESYIYRVQLGVFSEENNAETYIQKLSNKGIKAELISNGDYYYIYSGEYSNSKDAEKSADVIKKSGLPAYVKKIEAPILIKSSNIIKNSKKIENPALVLKKRINKQLDIIKTVEFNQDYTKGDIINYRLELKNNSNHMLKKIKIKDEIPAGLSFVNASISIKDKGPTIVAKSLSFGNNENLYLEPGETIYIILRLRMVSGIESIKNIYNDDIRISWEIEQKRYNTDFADNEEITNLDGRLILNYGNNEADLDQKYYHLIDIFARFINDFPASKINIEGHTDAIGAEEYNLKLADKRASNLRKFLINNYDIDPEYINSKIFGEENPLTENQSEMGRSVNRRVIARLSYTNNYQDVSLPRVMIDHYKEENCIKGVFGSNTKFFYVDENWELTNNNYLNLDYSHSQLNSADSTLTVILNKKPIYSIYLNKEEKYHGEIRISLPRDLLTKGYNVLELKTYDRLSDEPCTDDINYANWICFHNDTFISLEYYNRLDGVELLDYPYPFYKYNEKLRNTIILLPEKINKEIVKSLMLFSADMGMKDRYSILGIKTFKTNENINLKRDNIIYISHKDNIAEEFKMLLSKEELASLEDKTLLKELISPFNRDKKVLMIVYDNKESLIKAIRALSKKELVYQMDEESQLIDDKLQILEDKSNYRIKNRKYLSDLGYDNVFLQGAFIQQTNFNISLAANKKIKNEAVLYLKTRYSKALDFEYSLLTIYINNIPITSTKLKPENADDFLYSVRIPAELLEEDYLNLKVSFNLRLHDMYCRRREEYSAWAFISSDSYFYLPEERLQKHYLEDYPAPFVSDDKFNNLRVLLPDKLSGDDLKNLSNIFSYLGQNLQTLNGVEFEFASNYSFGKEDHNLIIYGSAAQNELIKKYNKCLHFKFDPEFKKFVSNDKFTLLEDYNQELASIQLIKASEGGNKILFITGTNAEALDWASRYLYDFARLLELSGDAMLIDKHGHSHSRYFTRDEESRLDRLQERVGIEQKFTFTSKTRNYLIFIGILLVIIVISILLLRRRN